MTRIAAILLILVFSSFTSAPLFASPSLPFENLPQCCQKNGKHHCIMRIVQQADLPGTNLTAPPQPCPYFPRAVVPATVQSHLFAPIPRWSAGAAPFHKIAAFLQPEGKANIQIRYSLQGRGPPVQPIA